MENLGQTDYRSIQVLSKEEVQTILTEYFKDPDTPRTIKEYLSYRKTSSLDLPSEKMINKYYGGWRNLLIAFNQTPPKSFRKPTKPLNETEKQALLLQARELILQLEGPITSRTYRLYRRQLENPTTYPSYEKLKETFGGWKEVIQALELEEVIPVRPQKRSSPTSLFSAEETKTHLIRYFQTVTARR